ncbi:ATP-dependent RNA helicase DBP5 [Geopyxis carbonaria]|nr:ATP-dependent RNA helicase DBP5 [Geopyxis carbonaria]
MANTFEDPVFGEGQEVDRKQPGDKSNFVFEKNLDRSQDFTITFADGRAEDLITSQQIQSFRDCAIPPSVLLAMANANILRPSKIQLTALPLLLDNPPRNLILQSQTGTGKTAAFLLNIVTRIDMSNETPQALILSPTRELARQTVIMLNEICAFGVGDFEFEPETTPKTQLAVPGEAEKGGKVDDAQIIIGTPGTVNNWIRRKLIPVHNMKVLVVDEADNMLDGQGLGEQCIRVKQGLPPSIQICLVSATFPEKVRGYAHAYAPGGNSIFLQEDELTTHNIRQLVIDVPGEEAKFQALMDMYHILCIGASIIFCKTRIMADRIRDRMEEGGHKVSLLHAGLETGAQRDAILDDFRCARTKVMVTTNVLARGFDMTSVSLVINYDLPRLVDGKLDFVSYLHRCGRTGRFGRVGIAISFVHDTTSWNEAQAIQKQWNVPVHWVLGDNIDSVLADYIRVISNIVRRS